MSNVSPGTVFNVEPQYIKTPVNDEFVQIYRNELDNKYYGRRASGVDELIGPPSPPTPDVPVNVGKTIYVDSVYGNNAAAVTGGIYDQRYSFLTIAGALASASLGDIIYVRKGTYTVNTISNPIADFYLEAGAIVQNLSTPDTFVRSDGGILNIYGEGTIINGRSGSFVIASLNNSTINVQCNLMRKINTILGGALISLSGATINAFIKEIDCGTQDFCYIAQILDPNSKINLYCDLAKYTFIGYLSQSLGGKIVANVKNTVAYNNITPNFFNGTGAGINNGPGGQIIINGDFSYNTTSNPNGAGSAILQCHLSSNGSIIHNGSYSKIRNRYYARIQGSASCSISFNSNIENEQDADGNGIYIDSGKIICKGKLKTLDLTTGVSIIASGGNLILDDFTYVSNGLSPNSILAAAPINIKVYKSVTNKPWEANVTNTILGSLNIVDAGVE